MNRIKKIAIGIVSVGGMALGLPAFAGTYITLPVDFIDDMLAYVGGLFDDLSVVIILVIGLPLAFWVIRKTISLVRAR